MKDPNINRRGYKKTKVGWIPEEWACVPLSEVALIQTGLAKNNNNKHKTSKLPYLRVANVQDGFLNLTTIKTIAVDTRDIERYQLRNGDVLFTEGGDFDKLGRGTIWKNEISPCLHQNHIFAVRCKKQLLCSYFLAAIAASPYGKKYFILSSKQSTNLASINSTQLKQFSLPLPPLPEQKNIAEILSTWDEAIDQTRRLIDAKMRRKKALMQILLTGRKQLPGFCKKWHSYLFKDHFKRVTRTNTMGCENVLTISGTLGLVNQKEYFNKQIAAKDLSNYYLIKRGEFAYNKSYSTGYPLGAIKMLEKYDEGVLSNLYICFSSRRKSAVHRKFMKYYFDSGIFNRELYKIAKEGARNHGLLNVFPNEFFATTVLLPPKVEQKAIAKVLEAADHEIKTLEQKLATLEKQKRGLMQKLLTGEVRAKR